MAAEFQPQCHQAYHPPKDSPKNPYQNSMDLVIGEFLNATLQGINISHLGKRKIIFKMPFWGDMLIPWRVPLEILQETSRSFPPKHFTH